MQPGHCITPLFLQRLLFFTSSLVIYQVHGQNYSVSQSGTYSIEIDDPTIVFVPQDGTAEIPIGFDFEFYGVTYTDCFIGSDGFVAFGTDPGGGCCGQSIPDNSSPNNLIAVAWTNMDWNSVHYEVYGSAPDRRLVITLDFLNPCDSSYYGQVKLFETTNVIEIHTQQWYGGFCEGWSVTQGLENETGSSAVSVPGRNFNDTWQVLPGEDDFVSFTPVNTEYIVQEADEDYNLEFGLPYDITIGEDSFAIVPLDFPFEFFGNSYDSVYIGFNGLISFEAPVDGGCCEGQYIPNASGPNNLIAAAWTDATPYFTDYNIYYYGTVGSAPNRKFVIEFDYGEGCGSYFYGQIHLLEEDFIIEIHTDYWADGNTPCANTTQGIENASGSQAYYLAGRNANTTWYVPCCGGDMVRFIPTSSLPQADAGVYHIYNGPYCEGTQMMECLIGNFGGQPIDSVLVEWTWDGVPQDAVVFQDDMPIGDTNYIVNLGEQELVFGESYELIAWTSMPNGIPDDNTVNDTMTATILVGRQGTFTIGGTDPDFDTFQEAIDTMELTGICDTVIFHVRPGTYNEQVVIPEILGSNGRTIIFTAENGDSSSVVLQYNSTTSEENYVLLFDHAHEIIWEKMTLNALSSNYGHVVELRNDSYNNTVRHCAINGYNTTDTYHDYACIFSRSLDSLNTFYQNTTTNGSYGFFLDIVPVGPIEFDGESPMSRGGGGGDDEFITEIKLIGNSFLQFSNKGIRTSNTKGIQIDRNHIESDQEDVWGMQISTDEDTLLISNNTVYLPSGDYGIHLSNINPVDGRRANIFNNMISLPKTTGTIVGAGLHTCSETNVHHNSIRLNSSISTSNSFHHSGGGYDSVYNNVFANMGTGKAIYLGSNLNNDYDYNDYYSAGSSIGAYGANSYTLEAWQTVTGFDDHSISANPFFSSSSNLHAIGSLLNKAGSSLLTTSQDIDQEDRDELTPDLGADEFTPVAEDAGITKLLSPTLTCDAEQEIEVVLANLGSDTLESVTIQWTLNGIPQSDVLYTQSLMPEGDTAHVVLTTHIFSGQPDTIVIWTSMPNDSMDLQPDNDTLMYRFRLPFSGIYTIGGTDPDFTTFTSAVADLNIFHNCGPVTFRFRDGTYTEQVVIDSIPTTSATNTITFESESMDSSAVTIEFTPPNSSKPYVILLSGTDHVIFRHIGIKALPAAYSDVLELRYSAKNIKVSHCKLEGYHFGSSSVLFKSLNFGGVNDSLILENNYFLNGWHAMYLVSGADKLQGLYIDNNIFVNQRFNTLDLSGVRGLYIRDNTFSTNTTNSSTSIDLSSTDTYTQISGNQITRDNIGDGMFLDGMNFFGSPGTAHVYNNMVNTSGAGNGIRIWNSVNTYSSYNNINVTGTGFAFEITGGDSSYTHNNVLAANSGRAFKLSTFEFNAVSDHNDLYSISGPVGSWNDTIYNTLSEWQTETTLDSNSMSIDPQFVSATDLHVLADTLDGAGTPIAGITLDFDENPRNAMMPDIGADEIGANDDDAGVFAIFPEMPFARGNQDVQAVIRNYGGNTITSMEIHWKLNGVSQTVFNYTGSLPSLQYDTVTLGTVEFLLSTPYAIQSWTSEPNGNPDFYNSNDTLLTNTRYPAVSDTVTVGGASPDVPTIAAAVTALSLGGVLDSVHFQIRNGTYHATLTLPQTLGMDCNTPIIFESESGNPADVIWDNLSLSNHTIVLDGADGVIFKNLTIKTVQLAYHAIEFKNGAHCNTFMDCLIYGMSTTSTSTTQATIYSYGTQNNDNTFIDNTISLGSYGIYWDGNYNTTGALVEGNIFQNAYYSGLTVSRQISPMVVRNTVTTNTAYSYFYGIYLNECTLHTILSANQVLMAGKRGVGILFSSCHGNVSEPGLVSNNFVILGQSTYSYGIQHHYCSWTKIYNNTVRVMGGGSTGIAYYRSYATNVDIKNNIFDNRADGTAMYFGGNEGPLTSDYNDLYSTGVNLVYHNGINYADLEAWQATDFDTSSISVDPAYVDDEGYAVTSAALNATGVPLMLVPFDIEGEVRDTLTPDIGCDEFDLVSDDVGILSINYPTEPFPSGENTVFIKFINNGQDTLVSMQVDWEVDSMPQPTYYWTGLLPSAGTYDSLDIGIFDFAPYMEHTIKVWVSLPNGVEDGLASNDTLLAEDLYPALLGTYTIGGTNPDFDSISIAVAALNGGGAAGAVTFNIRTGTYLETININDYPGSDCDHPVVFQSETQDSTDVIIKNLGIDDNIVTLNGADGVIFKHLTLQSVNPAYQNVVDYFNGAHCNQFLNNHLIGYESTSTSDIHSVILSSSSLDTANVIMNNWIQHGSIAIRLNGTGVNAGTLIQNNLLDQNYYMGIYAASESDIHILQNEIISSDFPNYLGIYLVYCNGPNRIERNDIRCTISDYVLYLETCHAMAGDRGRIVNNFLSTVGTSGTVGLLINNSKRYDVFHNNINVNSTIPSTALYFHTDSSLHLANNIVVNSGNGAAIYGNNQTSFVSDYNDIFATGSFGSWNGAGVANLAAWQTATGEDDHSLSLNPQYMSASDLHISNILLNGAGQPLPSVLTDFDDETRDSIPDMGADEFDPSIANDAGVFMFMGPTAPFASGSQPVTIALKNYGYENLTSADIRWLVNGIEQPVYAWTGNLGSAQCDTVIIGNYIFGEYTDHDFILWSESPNGVPDSTHVNDTSYVDNLYPALIGTYTVGGITPDFNLFSQLANALNYGGILGDVTFSVRNGIHSTQFVIYNFPRTNYNHQVTFQSESGDSSLVTIKKDFFAPATNYTIRLSDAHNIIFRDLTLASTQGRVLDIADESSKIDIQDCRFQGVDISYASGGHQLIYSSTTTEDTLHIVGNRFEQGDYAIYLTASGGDLEKEVSIENNYFLNARYRSIHTHNHDGLQIKDNTILNNQDDHEGIAITASVNTKEISGNDIRLLHGGSYGLYLHFVSGNSGNPTKIFNNYILIKNWPYASHGIYHSYGDYNNFYYNTIRLESTGGNSSGFTDAQSFNHINIRNCILANYSGGVAIYNSWYPGFNTNTMDYCNLYTTGSLLANYYFPYNDLEDLQTGNTHNQNSVSAEPLFSTTAPYIFQAACDGAADPIAGITTDLEGETRHATLPDIGCDEFTLLAHDIGAKFLMSPETYCGLSDEESIAIRIQNYGASTETGFDVAYSLDGSGWVVENVGALSILPGGTGDYIFSVTEDLSQVGIYEFALRTSLGSDLNLTNDTIWEIEVEHIPALTQPVSNMIPTNGEIDLDKPVSLSWAPAPDATLYDVYIWEASGNQPGTPQIVNLTQINTLYNTLDYGTSYKWRVVAKNICNQMTNSPIHQFTVRELPDLVIDTVIAPPTAFSGEQIEIEWQTLNIGPGNSLSQVWADAVYLSTDATLNISFDTYLGTVQNLTALDSGIAYTNFGTFTIPNGFAGNFYVFVYADRWNNLIESVNNNNWERTPSTMMITLSPSPDLNVITVVAPSTTFSGQTIPITGTIKNTGTGPTLVSNWHDRVYFGSDPLNYGTGQHITTIAHSGILEADSTYEITANVSIPQGIFGERYVYVVSDFNDVVFENAAESNNAGISDTIDVILTPPPDLVAYDLQFPDTIHNNQVTTIQYTLENQGGSNVTNTSWYDQIYFSPAPVYNINFLTSTGTRYNYGPMIPFDPTLCSHSFTMPTWASGEYYYYLNLDKGSTVFEHTFESNNIIRSDGTFLVVNPDFATENLEHLETCTAGQTIALSWEVINQGPGHVFNRNWQTKIYISADETWNAANATLLKTLFPNINFLGAEDTILQSTTVTVPNGLSGDYFFHVFTDAIAQVFEDGMEANNIGTSSMEIEVSLPPYPDLRSREINVPDTITAGEIFTLQYEAANIGMAAAPSVSTDSFFLSFSPTWNPITNTALGKKSGIPALAAQDSSPVSVILPVSTHQNSNVYYLYVKSDANGNVFEYLNENNNIQRSNSFFINPAPAVDLRVDTVMTDTDTILSGTSLTVNWKVTNQSDANTSGAGWRDAFYLSVDSVLNTELDIRFYDTEAGMGGLDPGEYYDRSASPTISNGLSGYYYLIVVTDDLGVHMDEDSLNNRNTIRQAGDAVPLYIQLSPSPDLVPVLFSAPSSTYSGQPFIIIWSTENDGDSTAQDWVDKIYLSTDNTINEGDIILTTGVRNDANLLPDETLQDTAEVFVNSQYQGNYILILKTDADNAIYEHLGESNNQITRSILFTPPPPSDLLVTSILVPDSTIAGNTISISWHTMNSGTNPTNGLLREIVYLSTDEELDVDDRLFGYADLNLFIPPGNYADRSMTADVSGVSQDDYFALVQTDARGNITESNDTNNISASIDMMNVSIEELFLDSLTVDSFYNGLEHYYRLEIPVSAQGENLRVTVDGDSLGLFTEMYIKYGTAPTLSDFEQKHLYPFEQDQELLLEGLEGGTYYLMFKGHTTHSSGQLVTILARIVDFELLSIAPEKGLNRGQTTIELLGTQMDTLRKVYLLREGTFLIAPVEGNSNHPVLYVPGSYQGWDPADTTTILASPGSNDIFEGYLFLPDSLNQILFNTGPDWDVFYGDNEGDGVLELNGDSIDILSQGFYRFNVNLNTLAYSLDEYNWAVRGSAIEFADEVDQGMVYNDLEKAWQIELELIAGSLTFRASPDTLLQYGDNGGDGILEPNGSDIIITAPGNYLVSLYLDPQDPTYSIQHAGFDRIEADTIYVINSYRAFATFTLEGAPVGLYTVQAIRWDGKIAQLIDAFEVIEDGEEPDLQITMDYPAAIGGRQGPMKITVFLQNAGDRDIVGQSFRFEAPWGNLLAYSYEDLISGNTLDMLEIPVEGAFGPPGILPPNAGNVIEIFAYKRPHPTFTLTPIDE